MNLADGGIGCNSQWTYYLMDGVPGGITFGLTDR